MNIQPLGLPAAPRIDDRQGQSGQPAAVAAVPAAAGAPAPTRDQVLAAVQQINKSLPAASQTLEFSLDDDSKEMVIKVVDQSTKEVVRQIPSVEALEIAKSLDKMMGLLIRQKA